MAIIIWTVLLSVFELVPCTWGRCKILSWNFLSSVQQGENASKIKVKETWIQIRRQPQFPKRNHNILWKYMHRNISPELPHWESTNLASLSSTFLNCALFYFSFLVNGRKVVVKANILLFTLRLMSVSLSRGAFNCHLEYFLVYTTAFLPLYTQASSPSHCTPHRALQILLHELSSYFCSPFQILRTHTHGFWANKLFVALAALASERLMNEDEAGSWIFRRHTTTAESGWGHLCHFRETLGQV